MITTSTGSTVRLDTIDEETVIILDSLHAPEDMRNHVAGRVVEGFGFQPVPFALYALRPEVLRAIADLVDGLVK